MATLRDLAAFRISQQLLNEVSPDRRDPKRQRVLWWLHVLDGAPGEMSTESLVAQGHLTSEQVSEAQALAASWTDAIDTAAAGLLQFEPAAADADKSDLYSKLTAEQVDTLFARVDSPLDAGVEAKVQAIRVTRDAVLGAWHLQP
jgi:hypothetical protein